MVAKKNRPTEVPPEVQQTLKSLEKWLDNGRRSRGVPEHGAPLARLSPCNESCTLHDSDA